MSSKKTGKPAGKAVTKTADTKGRQSVKSSENKTRTKPAKRQKGTFGVVAGTRKEEVAAALNSKGVAYATDKALALGIKAVTVKSWISQWRRMGLWKPVEADTVKPKGTEAVEDAAKAAEQVAADVAKTEADQTPA